MTEHFNGPELPLVPRTCTCPEGETWGEHRHGVLAKLSELSVESKAALAAVGGLRTEVLTQMAGLRTEVHVLSTKVALYASAAAAIVGIGTELVLRMTR